VLDSKHLNQVNQLVRPVEFGEDVLLLILLVIPFHEAAHEIGGVLEHVG
jgi:hypothetical protein